MAGFAYFGEIDLRCKKEQYPIVEYASACPGSDWNGFVYDCELLFILEGTMHITNGFNFQAVVDSPRGIFLIPGQAYKARFTETTHMIRFRLDGNFPLREYFRTDKAELLHIRYTEHIKSIAVNDRLHLFLTLLHEDYKHGGVDSLLAEIKRKELFHILNNHYDRQEILLFLFPLFSDNYSFMSFVYNNYRKVKSIREFARLSNYSLSGFCERFKAAFGMSAYRWMMEKRNYVILGELLNTSKQVKQIAAETGFSLSQFCDYCRKHFGMTAKDIRKYGVKENTGLFGVVELEKWRENKEI